MNKIKKRVISQISFFFGANLGAFGLETGLCYPFFYCNACPAADAACPIRAIEISLFKGNFNLKMLLYPLLTLGFIGILFGRGVCGWACPIGFLQRGTGRVAKKCREYPFIKKLGNHKIEPYLRYLKYIGVIALVIITPYFIGFMFTDICPVGVLTGTIPILILNPGQFIPSFYFYPAIVIFILFIILILVVERGWCKYFCPVGAILAPFNKISLSRIEIDKEKCNQCKKCNSSCPMGIDIPTMNRSPECILCGECVDSCPKNIINLKKGFS